MKSAILSLVTVAMLLATATDADARPPRYRVGYAYPSYGSYYRAYPAYWGGYSYPRYGGYYGGYYPRSYGGYYPNYVYPASGFGLTIGRPGFAITIGSGSAYPYWGGYSPYWGGYPGWRW